MHRQRRHGALLERIPSSLPRWCPRLRVPAEYARLYSDIREYADSIHFLHYSVVPSHTLAYSYTWSYTVAKARSFRSRSLCVVLSSSSGAHLLPARGSQCSSPHIARPIDLAPYRLRYATPVHIPALAPFYTLVASLPVASAPWRWLLDSLGELINKEARVVGGK